MYRYYISLQKGLNYRDNIKRRILLILYDLGFLCFLLPLGNISNYLIDPEEVGVVGKGGGGFTQGNKMVPRWLGVIILLAE